MREFDVGGIAGKRQTEIGIDVENGEPRAGLGYEIEFSAFSSDSYFVPRG